MDSATSRPARTTSLHSLLCYRSPASRTPRSSIRPYLRPCSTVLPPGPRSTFTPSLGPPTPLDPLPLYPFSGPPHPRTLGPTLCPFSSGLANLPGPRSSFTPSFGPPTAWTPVTIFTPSFGSTNPCGPGLTFTPSLRSANPWTPASTSLPPPLGPTNPWTRHVSLPQPCLTGRSLVLCPGVKAETPGSLTICRVSRIVRNIHFPNPLGRKPC